MRILFLLNSDFGIKNTIGIRAEYITNELKKIKNVDLTVLCRGYKKGIKNIKIIQIFPYADVVMKFLTATTIYISQKFPAGEIKNYIFEYFLKKKIIHHLEDTEIIHSWDFLPKIYRYIKFKNKNIKLIQDVVMAFPSILKIEEKKTIWKGDIKYLPTYVKESLNYVDYFIVPSDFVKDSLIKEKISEQKILLYLLA